MSEIALVGNPNSGKTTLFNYLTGSSQKVGNWPGVTVDKKTGKLKGHPDVAVVDLPGIYSLSPHSPEEIIARDYIISGNPDAIINIVDATNLERNLYLTTQLRDMGVPVVVALNMMDVSRTKGEEIDIEKLSKWLGCPVVPISALKKEGLDDLVGETVMAIGSTQPILEAFPPEVEEAIATVSEVLEGSIPDGHLRWSSVKLIEGDEAERELHSDNLTKIDAIVSSLEATMDGDGETIIIDGRYNHIAAMVAASVKRPDVEVKTFSDKVDAIVTNKWPALPIFFVVMFTIYYLSITTIGGWGTDWVNEAVFEEWAIPGSREWLEGMGVSEWLVSLLSDGLITGVGAVLGFLPQMLVMFLLLAVLEDSGYMARVAFVMDRIFRRFGLSGKSFIPILITTGCGVPGIMASRTIEDDRDRRITAMTCSFMPCAAKLPVIALIAGAIFNDSPWVAPSMYFIGVFAILFSGVVLKKIQGFVGTPAPFIMEMPAYHMPNPRTVAISSVDRLFHFVKKAGTIIVLASALVWFLSTYSWSMSAVEVADSMLADIGRAVSVIFAPLGWDDWMATVATVTGLIAKENVVSTFGILFGFDEVSEAGEEIWGQVVALFPSAVAGYSFLLFNMLCAPCFAAIGAMHRELGTWRDTALAVGWQCILAYSAAFIFYHFGTLATGGGFSIGFVFAVLLLIALAWLFARPISERGSMSEDRVGVSS